MKSVRILRKTAIVIPDRVAQRALTSYTLDAATGCHISTYSTGSHGYAQLGWKTAGEGATMTLAHRAAWSAINGQIPYLVTIDHLCHVQRCVNVDHLRLLSNLDNATDGAHQHWLNRRGWTFTDDDVVQIVAAVAGGETHRSIAARYGVKRQHITTMVCRQRKAVA